MKKPILRILICLAPLLAAANIAAADTITIASDPWCPYNCAQDAENQGYMIEVLKVILTKAGHQLRYENMPWSRCLDHVQKGKIDAVVGATKGEAEGSVFPDEEFGVAQIVFHVKKGNPWRYNGPESLKKVKIGIQADYEYGPVLDNYIAANQNTPNVQPINSDEPLVLNIRKLLKDRIDMIPEDRAVFGYTAKKMGVADQLETAGKREMLTAEDLESSLVYVAFAPGKASSKVYAKLFTDGIREMRTSGELAKILDTYGLTDWKPDLIEIRTKLGLK